MILVERGQVLDGQAELVVGKRRAWQSLWIRKERDAVRGSFKRRGTESSQLLVLAYASAIFGPSSISGAPRCMSSGTSS